MGKVRVVDFFVVLVNVAARFFPLAISVAAAQTLHDKPAWRCAALGAIFDMVKKFFKELQ